MGVLGLSPFLLKHCPAVVRELPHRFRSLNGKTIAIDGTLITQRFHYAPFPHQYRHVLGWYRLAQELQDNNLKAICIFDGKERNYAKAREVARRKEVQRVTVARGGVERERFGRLQNLSVFLRQLDSLTPPQKGHLAQTISESIDWDSQLEMTNTALLGCHSQDPTLDTTCDQSTYEDITETSDTTAYISSYTTEFDAPRSDTSMTDYTLPSTFPDIDSETIETLPTTFEDIVSSLSSLYQQYRSSTSKLARLAPENPSSPEILFSKSQYRLTQDEGQFWQTLLSPTQVETDPSALDQLAERSKILSLSYERRINSPTAQTYAECRAIIGAMGIPCIETAGPFEAEALASSLVHNGIADYVASEDTDVLVYEAPLLRNVTNRGGPLQTISGSEVRDALQLSQASYIDFAILLGTDFSDRIKNVGPARALKFIREYNNIEAIVEHEVKYPPRGALDVYLQQVAMARQVFKTLPPIPDDVTQLRMQEVDDTAVKSILQRCGLGRIIEPESWDYDAALAGNYYNDCPAGI